MIKRIIIYILLLSAYSYSESLDESPVTPNKKVKDFVLSPEDVKATPSSESGKKLSVVKKVVKKRPGINAVIYDLIDQLVDYFQGDINSMKYLSFEKKYKYDKKSNLWKKDNTIKNNNSNKNVSLGVGMLSKNNLNIAIVSVDVDPKLERDAKVYLYNEVMGRSYKTKDKQIVNFIDTFALNTRNGEYKNNKIEVLNKKIDEKYVNKLRNILYFDYYAQLRLIRKGVNLMFQIVVYDANNKGIVLVLDYNKIIGMLGTLPVDFSLNYNLSFGVPDTVFIPMSYSIYLGKQMIGIGSFGFDLGIQTYMYNRASLGDELALKMADEINESDLSGPDRQKIIDKYAFSSIMVGPYILLNINQLARKRSSIFEFYIGSSFRVGYYVAKTDIYKPLYFDFSIYERTNIGHWFFVNLGINSILMYPNSKNTEKTKTPFNSVNFVLSLGLNIF